MPGGWLQQRDVRKLSETRAEFDWVIPIAQLPGIEQVLPESGPVHAHLRFGAEQGWNVARVELSGQVAMVCQRCMQPMTLPLQVAATNVALVAADSDADAVPEDWETFLAADGLLTGAQLVAEELLLALPIVPLHALDTECAARPVIAVPLAPAAQAAADTNTQESAARPFAQLRALLERDRH